MTGRRSMPELHQIRLSIPLGFEDYWSIIRDLDTSGPWTIAMIVQQTRTHHEVVGRYVRRLRRGGFAEVVGHIDRGGLPAVPQYRLTSRPSAAPRLREDGSQCPPTQQEQMWVAMRNLAQFDARELAYAASTDVVRVNLDAAKSYVARLNAAGYLIEVRPSKGRTLALWRLKPAMNTGPAAPKVMHTRLVWDPNRSAVMGTPTASEGGAR
ncbi:hypothetical protein [Ancylobacter sp. G4_0304]|uniref:hypothetical protein n=1 Tax=Ancylobacter sp. G4_0304 TaxID=3114289 RepID=UPI0039C63771